MKKTKTLLSILLLSTLSTTLLTTSTGCTSCSAYWNRVLSDLKKTWVGDGVVHYIKTGYTERQVISSWGQPDDKMVTVGSWGKHEMWTYGTMHSRNHKYLHFENGILTGWTKL